MEFKDYSKVKDEVGSADIHGVVTSLSPSKKSKKKGTHTTMSKYVMASRACILVGFASSHQKILQDFLERGESVEIRNC